VIDPCERAVCRDAVGKHIELVGRAIGRPTAPGARYKLVWQNLIIKTMTQFHDSQSEEIRVPVSEAVRAASERNGGAAWLAARSRADTQYEPLVARDITKVAAARRVALAGPPSVSRQGGEAAVMMRIHSDRVRVEQHVLDAMAAAETALRQNPATPAQ